MKQVSFGRGELGKKMAFFFFAMLAGLLPWGLGIRFRLHHPFRASR